MSDVTLIQSQIETGDPSASEKLLPLVYDELRKLAAAKLAFEKPGQTLQPTALVHEAYLRLVGTGEREPAWDNRGHFFAAAAEAMRRILVERARRVGRLKRGGDRARLELLDQAEALAEDPDLILSLDELLLRLQAEDPVTSRVANLHLFAGLSVEEVAQAEGISRTIAYRHWKFARAWLREALQE